MNTRIYIIGGLGSGKSFLAKKLSEKTGVEHFDLDRIVFKEQSFEERGESERGILFESILKQENWIVEGTFTESWIVKGLEASSQIIYMTTPPLVRLYRFILRIFGQGISHQNNLFGRTALVLGFKYKEWDRSSTRYEELLSPYTTKTTKLSSAQEVTRYLKQL